jgi:hypothetical protein
MTIHKDEGAANVHDTLKQVQNKWENQQLYMGMNEWRRVGSNRNRDGGRRHETEVVL